MFKDVLAVTYRDFVSSPTSSHRVWTASGGGYAATGTTEAAAVAALRNKLALVADLNSSSAAGEILRLAGEVERLELQVAQLGDPAPDEERERLRREVGELKVALVRKNEWYCKEIEIQERKVAELEERLENQRDAGSDLIQRTADGYLKTIEALEENNRRLNIGFNNLAAQKEELESEVERLLDANARACEVRDSEIRQLREMNETHLSTIYSLQKMIESWAAENEGLKADLAEAREKGLSLGSAALKQGWGDCERAVVARIKMMTQWIWRDPEHALTTVIDTIKEGEHRPTAFDAHAPAWTGADEPDPGLIDPTGEITREAWKLSEGPLLQDHAQVDDMGASRKEEAWHRLCEITGNFRYPAGLPEEDPGSAPEGGEKALGVRGSSPKCRILDLDPLLALAKEAEHVSEFPEEGLTGRAILRHLREAGVIPGE